MIGFALAEHRGQFFFGEKGDHDPGLADAGVVCGQDLGVVSENVSFTIDVISNLLLEPE